MKQLMLDTNTVSYAIKGQPPEIRLRLMEESFENIAISAVTEAELLYGWARKGRPKALIQLIREFLIRVEVLPWDREAAAVYGDLRASCSASGVVLGALDMMIAAHAIASRATLVTHDKTFARIPGDLLKIEDWVSSEAP